jgi:DNA-binding NtrC family response regulator
MLHTVLIAEDDPIQRLQVRRMLESELQVEVLEAADGVAALAELSKPQDPPIAVALIDLGMPRLSGIELLKHMAQSDMAARGIVITGSEMIADAVEAMRLGAIDFINKPLQHERLITSVRNAIALYDLRGHVERLQDKELPITRFDNLREVSPGLAAAIALGRKAAGSDIPVLITGESGVGKEVFARAIHRESARRDKPMVAVNCGALPDNLVESTLFGHERGAFTGALARSPGKCREAEGGVLFLDEIGDLKPDTQVKLLRLLQEGEIEPVGSSKTVKVNIRIISATNHALEQQVKEGKFREDLFYRLQGFPIHLPALRERREDIVPLARYVLARIATAENRPALSLSADAELWLSRQNWAGNVRELQHLLHRSCLVSDSDRIDAAALAGWSNGRVALVSGGSNPNAIALFTENGQPKTMEAIEQEAMARVLNHFDAHVGKAAAALGIGQSTLYKRMKPAAHTG